MRFRPLLLLVAISALGAAQEVASSADIATLLDGATQEVLLAAPKMRSRAVAEALREALVVRGVDVYLLLPDATVDERASYALGLGLAGAAVRLSEAVGEPFVVIDRATLVIGPLVGALDGTEAGRTVVRRDAGAVEQAVAWFYQAFRGGNVIELELDSLMGGNNGW